MNSDSPVQRDPPLHIRWLVRLRWAAVAAQILSIVGVRFLLHAPFPLAPLVVIVGLLVAANIVLWLTLRAGRGLSDRAITANLMLDTIALTGLLVWTGGAMNPFTTLYLLHVALAAILVPRRWSLLVTGGAIVSFGGLLLARPEAIHVWHSASMFMLHVRGMWFAFALTALCLWVFVDRVSASLQQRDAELARARVDAVRAERLAALGTLAAGTAHELNTPLGTVAILAAELSRSLAHDPEARLQADKIRAEVRRCTEILTKMRWHEQVPEARSRVALVPWVHAVVDEWRARHPDIAVPVTVAASAEVCKTDLRSDSLQRALHSLLDNALLAVGRAPAPSDGAISVAVEASGDGRVSISVLDRGVGMSDEHLARAGEPFFTTREPGQGMGLGLFLVHATVEQHGGALAITSGDGLTRVRVSLPLAS